MKDVVLEWYIPYVMPKGKRLLKAVILASMVVLVVDTIIYPLLFLPVLAFVIIGILLLRSWRYEFEFVYVNGDFEVSKIIRKEKRRDLYRCERKNIEYVAKGWKQASGCRVRDFTSGWEQAEVYTMKVGNELIYLEPNKEFLEEMQLHRLLEKN